MKLLEGKVALITGASQGIGRSIALMFAENGADIIFTDIREDERSEAMLAELKAFGVRAAFYAADASSLEQTQEVCKAVTESFGRVDVLVNNAGITRDMLLLRMSAEDWERVIRLNLTSVFNYTKVFSSLMMRQRSGSIINMSSIVGVSGNAGQANYSASKAGIIGFTKSIAKELGSRNIRSNAIAPGFIETAMTKQLSEEVIERWKQEIPLRRPGTPDDVARLALFLASDLSAYITGQVICCDGGLAL
ncbi:MAG: 3-oxoacyl-[acyl-carrier-protein] reductase [Bacteroidales bacterium]|nr:3-oxoacyl-[acyl-carrier-protein] reductase [Bacteroidales bacterium]